MGVVIGIDPGITGGIAVIRDGELTDIFDMPVQDKGKPVRKRSKRTGLMVEVQKKEIDPHALSSIMAQARGIDRLAKATAVLEQVSPMVHKDKAGNPVAEGSVSVFSFGDSFGVIRGVLGVWLPRNQIHRVSPQAWKKRFELVGTDKDAARLLAIKMFPAAEDALTRKKDIGRADAILLAAYGLHELITEQTIGTTGSNAV